MILDDIIAKKKKRIEERFSNTSIEAIKNKAKTACKSPTVNFKEALEKHDQLAIISEIKKASPSKGMIKGFEDPLAIALEYLSAGASAISVLTEEDYFLGQDEHLVKVRQRIPLPVLRKDFIIDIKQIYESRIIGADAILLIVSILADEQLAKYQAVAKILGLGCLVEVHDEQELERALRTDADIIGINNRDLKTFKTDLNITARLINMIPKDKVVVSESGINSSEDARYLKNLGVNAILVGESLMKADNINMKIQELRGV